MTGPEYLPTTPSDAEMAEFEQAWIRLAMNTASQAIRLAFLRLDPTGSRVLVEAMKNAVDGRP